MKLKWQKRNPYVRRVKNLDVHEEHVREEKQLFLHSLRFSYWGPVNYGDKGQICRRKEFIYECNLHTVMSNLSGQNLGLIYPMQQRKRTGQRKAPMRRPSRFLQETHVFLENKHEIRTFVIIFVCASVSVFFCYFHSPETLGEPCFPEDTTLSQIKEALTKLLAPFVDSQMSST